jgi:ADP-ribose pyrophosphatase YjhB (NUDIX family)
MTARFFVDDDSAPTPNQPRRLGVAIAVIRNGTVLVERRSDSDLWAFIGGGVERHETIERAVRREVLEETGLTILDRLRVCAIYSSPRRITAYPDGNVSQIVTVAFTALSDTGEPTPSAEAATLAFVPLPAVADLPMAATHKAFADLVSGRGEAMLTMDTAFD